MLQTHIDGHGVKPYFDCMRQCRRQLSLVRAIKTKLRQCAQRNYGRPDAPNRGTLGRVSPHFIYVRRSA